MQLGSGRSAQEVFMEMTKVSAETLNVERVSIWRLSDDREQLECLSLYLKSKNLHAVAKPLQVRDLPNYFSHLASHRGQRLMTYLIMSPPLNLPQITCKRVTSAPC